MNAIHARSQLRYSPTGTEKNKDTNPLRNGQPREAGAPRGGQRRDQDAEKQSRPTSAGQGSRVSIAAIIVVNLRLKASASSARSETIPTVVPAERNKRTV